MNKFVKSLWQIFMSAKVFLLILLQVLFFVSSQCVTLGSRLKNTILKSIDPSVSYLHDSKARRIKWFKKRFIIVLLPLFSFSLSADNFVSTKSNKINMRTGPGFHYPVKWIYVCKNLPLKVIEEFEDWKKVCDINEECGWIKGTLLSNKHYAMIKEDAFGYKKQNIDSKVTMKIDKFVIMYTEKCDTEWCLLSASKRKAWVQKEFIYGID